MVSPHSIGGGAEYDLQSVPHSVQVCKFLNSPFKSVAVIENKR